jgi:LuxR family transcriptional regulator of spore coat protein
MIRIITKRENEIFQLLVDGYTTNDISNLLNISKKTVRNHISNVIQKLGVSNRNQAILELLKMKIVLLKNPY